MNSYSGWIVRSKLKNSDFIYLINLIIISHSYLFLKKNKNKIKYKVSYIEKVRMNIENTEYKKKQKVIQNLTIDK